MEEAADVFPATPLTLRLKLISRVALSSSLAAITALGIVLFSIGHDSEAVYLQVIQGHRLTEQMLGPALLLTGLILLLLVGVLTWLAASQVSSRVAGPLFRLNRNFEALMHGTAVHGIRRDDQLQDLSRQMQHGIARLHAHYQRLDCLAELAERQLDQTATADSLTQTLQELQREIQRVHLH
ncbi:MAG: hypothetical protein AB1450_09220 [Pseudomonadota bacterium]